MADGTWRLQDSPIFWFVTSAPAPPARGISGYTSYTLGFTIPESGADVPPEVEAAIRRGDQRYIRQG